MKLLLDLIIGDPQADRVVPPTGLTARLTIFVAAVMAFLAVIALALSMSAGRVADRWADELAQAATLRLPADTDSLQKALQILETTPGVASAHALTADEQEALLTPWFGTEIPLDSLPIPQLIEVIADDPPYDPAGLQARFDAEIPGAVFDDHGDWRDPLLAAAARVRLIGWLVILLIAACVAAMITLAAQASLAANVQVIRVLRLVGARDVYIARAFVRRFTLRAGAGAIAGVVMGVIVVQILPDGGGFFAEIGFSGVGWMWPVLIPLLAAGVAFFATRAAAMTRLKEQT
ncbi:cell division protein FtsX [Loktanella sp. D2R18]|uniref:cell division protein FtsX n=1 Tax=Rhodobacterales TaxID=204455 RepID=UPI000DE89EF4|nr:MULTISPECIES: FtsX-like permease family protein [Rhodobacterales]MDO6590785.1 FtsX-like permease family protein [Yoonia sp. 1_MG-2023]RBW43224.1 cell division protein FtsX [Loktanella sp. D2R18]